ncbi:hypothetical protein ACFL6I_21030, partial [candidate division KSB1 bacterium]
MQENRNTAALKGKSGLSKSPPFLLLILMPLLFIFVELNSCQLDEKKHSYKQEQNMIELLTDKNREYIVRAREIAEKVVRPIAWELD